MNGFAPWQNTIQSATHLRRNEALDFLPDTDGGLAGNSNCGKISIDEDNVRSGLAKLVLTLIKLLHELIEKQAIRRIEGGSLDDEQIERLGVTLMTQAEEIQKVCAQFNLKEEDLNLDLGPLGNLL